MMKGRRRGKAILFRVDLEIHETLRALAFKSRHRTIAPYVRDMVLKHVARKSAK